MTPLGDHYNAEFIYNLNAKGMALHLTIFKVQEIMKSSNGRVYVRRGAQNLPLEDEAALERLRFDKGLKSFEGTILNDVDKNEISNSITVLEFLMENMDSIEPSAWLLKQRVMLGDRPTVAGVLLYSDLPQTILPKRSSVKILRYQTKGQGERDSMMNDPVTIEGPIYNLVYDAVDKCKEIVEKIERLGLNGLEKVVYPEEALHEIVTNAVLHRDYSIATDVQIRIFDNRIEIESPGKLPGHVTVKNISTTQFSRNPQIVRLINKFKNPPNKDVGEGWNTAAEAMGKLRLKEPVLWRIQVASARLCCSECTS